MWWLVPLFSFSFEMKKSTGFSMFSVNDFILLKPIRLSRYEVHFIPLFSRRDRVFRVHCAWDGSVIWCMLLVIQNSRRLLWGQAWDYRNGLRRLLCKAHSHLPDYCGIIMWFLSGKVPCSVLFLPADTLVFLNRYLAFVYLELFSTSFFCRS